MGNQVSILATLSGLRKAPARDAGSASSPGYEVFEGTGQVSAALLDLERLAEAFGQGEEMRSARYLLGKPRVLPAHPVLLVFRASGGAVWGAVLLQKTGGPLGWFGLYTTAHWRGGRNVFGLAADRPMLAVAAGRALLARGARFVSMDFHLGGPLDGPETEAWVHDQVRKGMAGSGTTRGQEHEVAVRCERRQFDLPLAETYEATLRSIHKRTRANLRYYRRTAEFQLGSYFIADAKPTEAEFLELNGASKYGVKGRVARWRFRVLHDLPGAFCHGVRSRDGRWLSLVGGRRVGTGAEVEWQMNRLGLERYSLGTVMRCYLIEHEAERGVRFLQVDGGTSHPIAGSFRYGAVYNVSVRRPDRWMSGLLAVARRTPRRALSRHVLGSEGFWGPNTDGTLQTARRNVA